MSDLHPLRHSCAHLLAAAVLKLYPQALPTIGPSIDEGFYYDFDNLKITPDDLPTIEETMKTIVKDWQTFEKQELTPEQAKELFKHNPYKLELIEDLTATDQQLTAYKSGDFTDLCRGGHCLRPYKDLKHFKILSVAGAYWRGSEKNKMLTRIYGTCYPNATGLEEHLTRLEEAKKRDHKKLGPELDLFTFSPLVGAGLPLWTPKGTLLRNILDDFVWQLRRAKGYEKVEIPHITKKDLYEKSGHWDKFKDELFRITTREGHEFAMKPMNCPHHTQIFARKPHSYKEMPQRYANTTMVYRDEQTGELSGLSRVRSITQDDAHVFCRKSQIVQELMNNWDIIDEFYSAVGFKLHVRLSLHDPEQFEKYLGTREDWESAENQLRELAKLRGVDVIEGVGEAAFYGPKLDFMTHDSLGREWQVATNQLDLNMPNRFGLYCINEEGEKESIIMIHAAIMGSIERYASILIEHFAGAFPTWLAPTQIKVLPISDNQLEYAQSIATQLRDNNLRVEIDDEAQTLNAKIRNAQLEKTPYMIIIGAKEQEQGTITIRTREGKQIASQTLEETVTRLTSEIRTKSITLTV